MYNALMAIASLLIALLLPLQQAWAQQYIDPETMLLMHPQNVVKGSQTTGQQGQGQSSQGKIQFQEYWTKSSARSSVAASVAAVPATMHEGPPQTSAPAQTAENLLDPITLRLLDRLRRQPPTSTAVQHSTALHAGADLSGTGPGEILTLIVLGGAVAWTVYRSRRMEQFQKL